MIDTMNSVLVGGFKGRCVAAPLNGPLPDEFPPETSGYESDSDIEDDDELDNFVASVQTTPSSSALPATPGASAEGKKVQYRSYQSCQGRY